MFKPTSRRVLRLPVLLSLVCLNTGAPSAADTISSQWLEETRGARALEWVQEQNKRTLRQLKQDSRYEDNYRDALAIGYDEHRVPGIYPSYGLLRDGWIYVLWQDEAHPRGVWQRMAVDSYLAGASVWQVLLDVDALAREEGRDWAFAAPLVRFLPNSTRCLIVLLEGFSQYRKNIREFDVASASFVKDGFRIPADVSAAGVPAAFEWQDLNTLLVSTTWDGGSSASPTIMKTWRRGQPLAAATEVLRGPGGTWPVPISFENESGERTLLAYVSDQDRRRTYWKIDSNGKVRQISLPPNPSAYTISGDEWIAVLDKDWIVAGRKWIAGSVIGVSLRQNEREVPKVRLVFEPGPREMVRTVVSTKDALLVIVYSNVKGRLLRFQARDGRWEHEVLPLPDNGTLQIAMSEPTSDVAFVSYDSFLQPPTLYAVRTKESRVSLARQQPSQFEASKFVTEQLHAVSRDGTRVPYFIVRPKDLTLEGRAPTLMHGYGAFGAAQYPQYSGVLGKLWLERGGVYVLANIRGGGEFGPAWYSEVVRTNRQRVYDDFIAVAEDLIRRKITSPRHLGIHGMSAGGLLVGVMLVQRPELFRAAVLEVPLLDFFRGDLLHGGLGRDSPYARDFGFADVPEDRAFMERTSPYQNLRPRDDFPVPLLLTSTADDNVLPGGVRRYAAKMQSLNMPFFYYESSEGGHGGASTPEQRALADAILYTYLANRLMN